MPVIGSPLTPASGLVSDQEVADQFPGWSDLPADQRSALISAASAAVETYCRRSFVADDLDERYSSDATGRLFLRTRPIISIAEISAGPIHAEVPLVIDPSRYDYDPLTGEVVTGGGNLSFWSTCRSGGWGVNFGCWGPGYRDVRVQYRGGYELADVPMDVKQSTILTIRGLHTGTARDPGVSSISRGGRSISYAGVAQQTVMAAGPVADLLRQWVAYR
jgi:hypothetical protein